MGKDETVTLIVKISKLEDEVKKVVRRQDEIQKAVDLLFADREILEDLQASVQALKEIIIQNQQHQDTARTLVQADVKVMTDEVRDMKENIEDKTVIVKSKDKNLFNKLFKFFKREVNRSDSLGCFSYLVQLMILNILSGGYSCYWQSNLSTVRSEAKQKN